MYSLRTRSSRLKQTAIDFPCRKRRMESEKENLPQNSEESRGTPPKRARRTVQKCDSELSRLKKSLHHSLPSSLLCREDQLDAMRAFLLPRLAEGHPGALYISGAPGTGKTACLHHLLESSQDVLQSASVVTVNCMSVKSPQAIFSQIASNLLGSRASHTKSSEQSLVKYITRTHSKKMIVLVLDEIDMLDCRGQDVLYTLFEWPALPHSKLILIGIANALDLTERVLPRLKHGSCQPLLLHFPPYTREQITTILRERLGGGGIVAPMAIQFCARKVAAVHGDLRKALDVCRRAVELAESQNLESEKPLCVTVRHIAEIFSSSSTSSDQHASSSGLPLQQKLALCSLLLMVRGRKRKEVTFSKLHDCYCRVIWREMKSKGEGEGEFVDMLGSLESHGILCLKKTRETRTMKVSLKIQEGELEDTLKDGLLSSILTRGLPDRDCH